MALLLLTSYMSLVFLPTLNFSSSQNIKKREWLKEIMEKKKEAFCFSEYSFCSKKACKFAWGSISLPKIYNNSEVTLGELKLSDLFCVLFSYLVTLYHFDSFIRCGFI